MQLWCLVGLCSHKVFYMCFSMYKGFYGRLTDPLISDVILAGFLIARATGERKTFASLNFLIVLTSRMIWWACKIPPPPLSPPILLIFQFLSH